MQHAASNLGWVGRLLQPTAHPMHQLIREPVPPGLRRTCQARRAAGPLIPNPYNLPQGWLMRTTPSPPSVYLAALAQMPSPLSL